MRPRVSARSRRIRVIFGCRHGVRVVFRSFGEALLKAYFFGAQFFLYALFHPFLVYGLLVVKFT